MDKSAIGGFEASDTNRVISSTIVRDAWDISAFASYHQKSDVPADNRRVEIRFFSGNSQQDILNEENFFDRLQ